MQERDIVQILYPSVGSRGTYSDPGPVRGRRFTQDTPILPEVWIGYGAHEDVAQKRGLLLTPNSDSSVSELVTHLRASLAQLRGVAPARIFLAYNESYVVAHLTFEELIRGVLPLSV